MLWWTRNGTFILDHYNCLDMKFPNWMVNLLRGGGGELVSFEYLQFSTSLMILLVIHSIPHLIRTLDFLNTGLGM